MNDNEIIEALDFCEGYNGVSFCSRCPLLNKDNCSQILAHEAYSLINRQKAEIERLKFDLQIMRGAANSFKMHYNTAKAEGIKEFAERLKEHSFYSGMYGKVITIDIVKQIAKEMSDETENEDTGKRIYDDFMKSCKL